MVERKVSVRLAAIGGKALKDDLVAIGKTGSAALTQIGSASEAANAGLDQVSLAVARGREQLEQLAAKAARSANALKATASATTPLIDQINRMSGITPAIGKTTAAYLAQGLALDDLRARYNPIFGVIRRYRQALSEIRAAHLEGALSTNEMTAAISRERREALLSIAVLKNRTTTLTRLARASRGATLRLQQMFFQVNDIGVSLAGGQNPFLVLVQQGTQLAQIYGFGNGGVSAAFKDLKSLLIGVARRFWPVAVAIGVVTAALAGLTYEINQTTDVSVTMGDTLLAVWQLIRDGFNSLIAPVINALAPWFEAAWTRVVAATKATGNFIINEMKITYEIIKTIWEQLPAAFAAIMIGTTNAVIRGINLMISKTIEGLNTLIQAADRVLSNIPGLDENFRIGQLQNIQIEQIANPYPDQVATASRALDELVAKIAKEDPLGELFSAIKTRAVQNALIRIAETADKTGKAVKKATEEAKTGWEAALASLDAYVASARDIGAAFGDRIVKVFSDGEQAIANFVQTGKLEFKSLITSLIADMAKLAARRFIFGPIASGLSGGLSNPSGGLQNLLAGFFKSFLTPATSFAGGGHTGAAPRSGGLDGRGGFMALMHPQERIIDEFRGNREKQQAMPPVIVNIQTRDVESFRQSRTQVAADIQRAIARGRRGL
ncbi:phage tail tape measure C-terminal domain-containing protein [Pseudovibrio sp. Tun.PSC04-5.I4]|uniref:phage tail tape measure C-terminal domain-containing protein n=1 Tax=Pseudovibrio sp. Tun.PSC04-5.I4 TaxID=1798213 RepID=UPI000883BA96|nr:phage tail tape measure C-terminal domain-containing protein [Pseudovibrio sp. Tun.PSC04-5.I4]SDR39866.1 phage tail tape measure protein, lambda family [Pseudovibrio sp. Tun.PSC04-5.I4]